jgi:hypothetical protein
MAVLGIDLHKHESQVAVLPDEPSDEEPLEEVRVASTSGKLLCSWSPSNQAWLVGKKSLCSI